MAQNQNWGLRGGGGFLNVLGIIYLVKLIRERRRRRQLEASESDAASGGDAS